MDSAAGSARTREKEVIRDVLDIGDFPSVGKVVCKAVHKELLFLAALLKGITQQLTAAAETVFDGVGRIARLRDRLVQLCLLKHPQ
jgi:hypothetical protein